MTVLTVSASILLTPLAGSTYASADVAPVNPVRVDLNGHPANSGFLVFVEGDVTLNADEAEGSLALGGDLAFGTSYNVQAGGGPVFPTFTAPGDSGPTFLFVGGGVSWPSAPSDTVLKVLNNGFTKIADTSTFTAGNVDGNEAVSLYQVRQPGQPYGSTPRIEGTTSAQDGASIAEPVPADLIDIDGAFTLYRQITADLATCPVTTELTDPDTGEPLAPGWPAGTRGELTLVPGETNVVQISAADLANLASINYLSGPSSSTPLLINVTGNTFNGQMPGSAGAFSASNTLFNFPGATSITVTGGDSLEGTIYAPNAAVNWRPTQNIEGNVIASSLIHGQPLVGPPPGQPREIHDFPFMPELSCTTVPPTTTSTTDTSPTTDTPPTTDPSPTTDSSRSTDLSPTTQSSPTTDTSPTTQSSPTSSSSETEPTAGTESTTRSSTPVSTTSKPSTTGAMVLPTSTGPTLSNTGVPVITLVPAGLLLTVLGAVLLIGAGVVRTSREH